MENVNLIITPLLVIIIAMSVVVRFIYGRLTTKLPESLNDSRLNNLDVDIIIGDCSMYYKLPEIVLLSEYGYDNLHGFKRRILRWSKAHKMIKERHKYLLNR